MPRPKRSTALTQTQEAGPPAALAHYSTDAVLAIFDQIEQDLGGRSAVLSTLLSAPDHPESAVLIGLLADPKNDTTSLARLMKQGGISLGQLIDTMKQAGFARALVKSITLIADKAPAVVEDVLTRAAPHEIRCPRCEGLCTIGGPTPDSPPIPCPDCRGRGATTILPDLDRQRLALDLARLLPTKAPLIQQIDQRRLGNGSITAMTDLIKATDDLLSHARPAPRAPSPPGEDAPDDVIDAVIDVEVGEVGELPAAEDPAVDSPGDARDAADSRPDRPV